MDEDSLRSWPPTFPSISTGVRGRGYMIGLQMAGDPAPYQAALREAGLLAPTAGGNVIRLLPPLIATRGPPGSLGGDHSRGAAGESLTAAGAERRLVRPAVAAVRG